MVSFFKCGSSYSPQSDEGVWVSPCHISSYMGICVLRDLLMPIVPNGRSLHHAIVGLLQRLALLNVAAFFVLTLRTMTKFCGHWYFARTGFISEHCTTLCFASHVCFRKQGSPLRHIECRARKVFAGDTSV